MQGQESLECVHGPGMPRWVDGVGESPRRERTGEAPEPCRGAAGEHGSGEREPVRTQRSREIESERSDCLSPIPLARAACSELLIEIADQCLRMSITAQCLE